MISAQGDGIPWDGLLDYIENQKERIISEGVIEEIKDGFGFKDKHITIIQSNLYHMLHQYTKGSTSERVITASREMALDQYRTLYFEGMHVTPQALFLAKGRVWRVQEVKKPSDFAAAIDEWERDRDFLQRHDEYRMSVEDQQYVLLNICPADLRKEIMKEYNLRSYPTYLSLKQHVLNLITRDRDMQPQSRGVHGLDGKEKKPKTKAEEWWPDESAWNGEEEAPYPDGTEAEGAQSEWTGVNALKGGSKGKGKGKQGKGDGIFHGECHICGEWGHSKRFCPQNKGKGKGSKGKGKGKGKGKDGKGFQPPGGQQGGKGGGTPPWLMQRPLQQARVNLMGDDPSNWMVGQDGRVARRDQYAQAAVQGWANPNWNQWNADPNAGAPAMGAQQAGFQVPQLGSVVGMRMMSIGAVNKKPMTTGPKYFQGDIEDDQGMQYQD